MISSVPSLSLGGAISPRAKKRAGARSKQGEGAKHDQPAVDARVRLCGDLSRLELWGATRRSDREPGRGAAQRRRVPVLPLYVDELERRRIEPHAIDGGSERGHADVSGDAAVDGDER